MPNHLARAALHVGAACLLGLVAACGGEAPRSDCADPCFSPPAPACSGDALTTWSPLGECVDGACVYAVAATRQCADGCADGACVVVPDPCEDIVCNEPPAASCEATVRVTYAEAGTCADGLCSYAAVRRDCAELGQVCDAGRCVAPGVCDDVDCSTPPAPACRGRIAVTFADGTCDAATGECAYSESTRDCNRDGLRCRDGACVEAEPCEGLTCDAPASSLCEGSVAVALGAGRCDPETDICTQDRDETECFDLQQACEAGRCVASDACDDVDCSAPQPGRCDGDLAYAPDTPSRCDATSGTCRATGDPIDCAASGLVCSDGLCVEPGCTGVVCSVPPADRCDDNAAIQYPPTGVCDAGRCSYTPERVDCEVTTQVCAAGRCVDPEPCALITCDRPPTPTCAADTATQYPALGECSDGECSYAPVEVDCAAAGQTCREGACVDRCTGVVCDETPAPYCLGDTLRAPSGGGICLAGACRFSEIEVNCAATGQRCLDGGCRSRCYGVVCDEPPAPLCDGALTRVSFADAGTCSALDASCRYAPIAENCGASGQICRDGACVPRPCEGVTCDAAADPWCDGDELVTEFGAGVCDDADGECNYPVVRTSCTAGGGDCRDGRCREVCEVLGCDSPPAPVCAGDTLVTSLAGGCDPLARVCNYPVVVRNCTLDGLACRGGACVTPPCQGVACDAPASPYCDGETAVSEFGTGTCDPLDGVCSYASNRLDCTTDGGICREGACLSPCDFLVCDDPPADTCAGDLALDYAPGACDERTQDCVYEPAIVNCGLAGDVCRDGRCVAPPCLGLSCNAPPAPTCEGTVRVTSLPGGRCDEWDGSCAYDADRFDCALLDQGCVDGACVTRCVGVTCDEPPADFCTGETLRRHAVSGECDAATGECSYAVSSIDCTATGQLCRGDRCVVNPCNGVTCDRPPEDRCDGSRVTMYFANTGACAVETGACTYASVVFDCAASGLQCVDGECVSLCAGEACSDPPADFCSDSLAITYRNPGACDPTNGQCAYGADITPCDAGSERCEDGRCVAFDPCEGAVCDFPPPPACDGRVAVVPDDIGACVDGVCEHDETRTDCAASGRFCLDGACVASDPCRGIVCGAAPASGCLGDTAVSYADGVCSAGYCEYGPTLVDCAAAGQVCETGRCVVAEPCGGGCESPPVDRCDGDDAIIYASEGFCMDDRCQYPSFRDDCDGRGLRCANGACVAYDPCEGILCATPPAPFCMGPVAVISDTVGTCDQGVCLYGSSSVTNCADTGDTCEDGACVGNPCSGVVCPAPSQTCETDTLLSLLRFSECRDGVCEDAITYLDCAAEVPSGRCVDGACLTDEPCGDDPCTTPPPAYCVDRTAIRSVSPGVCTSTSPFACAYTEVVEDCAAGGGFCLAGACVSVDPCEGVVCDDPPQDTCSFNIRVFHTTPGTCSAGVCNYALSSDDCAADDLFCFEGACQDTDPCVGVDCSDVDVPFCDGDVLVTPAPGLCNAGECSVIDVERDCALEGGTCEDGACVGVDPCFAVSCDTAPPATCRAGSVVSFVEPGVCVEGLCVFDELETACSEPRPYCDEGTCRSDVERLDVGDLVFSELMLEPDDLAFIEVVNRSGREVDLDGLGLLAAGSGGFVVVAGPRVVPAGGILVFGPEGSPLDAVDIEWDDEFVWEPGDRILLVSSSVIHELQIGLAWPFAPGVSVQRDATELVDDGGDAATWCASTLAGPSGLLGSPGAANEECPEVVDP